MDHATIIQKLIERTANDFVTYFENTDAFTAADRIIATALTDPLSLQQDRDVVESMLPDTEDDGRWEASYALNTGAMVLALTDYLKTRDEERYRDAVTLFFDTVDFKVHQDLESRGITTPTEDEIATHPRSSEERSWFATLEASAQKASGI